MLLQVLGSNVTELALQLVVVLRGVGNTVVDAILVECCGGGCSWEGGKVMCCQQVMVLNALILPVVPQSPRWDLEMLVLPDCHGMKASVLPLAAVAYVCHTEGYPAATCLCLGFAHGHPSGMGCGCRKGGQERCWAVWDGWGFT